MEAIESLKRAFYPITYVHANRNKFQPDVAAVATLLRNENEEVGGADASSRGRLNYFCLYPNAEVSS